MGPSQHPLSAIRRLRSWPRSVSSLSGCIDRARCGEQSQTDTQIDQQRSQKRAEEPMNYQQQRNEHVSTYCVEDRSSKDDLTRLRILDQMMTQAMGGVLPEQPDQARLRHVLDVGCGTGG